jgi:hypothetical protein
MQDEDRYTKVRRVNRKKLVRKEDAKVKKLQKEQERTSRPHSFRLGKNAKKQSARTNIILDQTREEDSTPTAEQAHKSRVILRRQLRKPSHRDPIHTRMEETEHLESLEIDPRDEYPDDGFSWGKWMAEISEEAHKERRRRKRAAKVQAAIEEERRIQSQKNKWRATQYNYHDKWDLDDDYYEEPFTRYKETRCCTGYCIIYEKVK